MDNNEARRVIGEALIPPPYSLHRFRYCVLGDDAALVPFLPRIEYDQREPLTRMPESETKKVVVRLVRQKR
jgi:hypothetical protein